MAKTNIELYEALKEPVGDEAARLIAEVVPAADDLATKRDIADLRAVDLADVRQSIADLRTEMHAEFSRFKGLLLAAMVPMWAGLFATLITVLIKA